MADDLDSARGLLGHKKAILEDSPQRSEPHRPLDPTAQAANALTLSRLVMASAWIWLFHAEDPGGGAIAIAVALAAAATDFTDGRVARRMAAVSARGKWLDSVADVVFVLSALGCFTAAGAIAVYIPILIAISFGQYAIDSMLMAPGRGPIRSRLGHYGGVINYALVIALAVTPPLSTMRASVGDLAPFIAAFYVAAIIERAIRYRTR